LLDIPDAYIVEAAWGSLPEFARYILRAHYCLRWPVPQTCRVVRRMTGIPCHQREFAKHLADAHEALAAALERDAQANRQIVRKWARKVLAILSPQRYKHTTTEQVRVA
jgi:dsRNA-specific ribonuclease